MKKAVIDENIPYLRGVLEPWFEVEYLPGSKIDNRVVKDASALVVRTRTRCDEALLAGSAVEFIATTSVGFDHVDTAYCRRRGITFTNAAGSNARAVMQYVAAALVSLSQSGGWAPGEKTIGVVGVGHVGSLVAELARQLRFRVVCCDPPRMEKEPSLGFVALEELLHEADIVTLHVPLDGSTLGMAGDRFFDMMKRGGVFINTSRGAVHIEASLKNALKSEKISGAALDVWNGEPDIDPETVSLVTLGTPHVAGYSIQGKANGTSYVVRSLARYYGLPLAHWQPQGVPPQVTGKKMAWEELCSTIGAYFDIEAQSRELAGNIRSFESLRLNYNYRTEYF